MTDKKQWTVTTSGDRPLSEVKKELGKHGFRVTHVLDEIGCITGTAGDDVAEKARSIRGVTDVSPDVEFDVGPPDAEIS